MTLWDTRRFDSRDAAEAACALWLAEGLRTAQAAGDPVGLLLSGGSTPGRILPTLLGTDGLDWDKIDVAASDERLATLDHPDSTEAMIRRHFETAGQALHYASPLSATGQVGDPQSALTRWRAALTQMRAFPSLGLIGIGGDAHIASLFPGQAAALEDTLDSAAVPETPPHKQPRLTLGLAALARVDDLALVVAGADKIAALERCADDPQTWPLGRLAARTRVTVFQAD